MVDYVTLASHVLCWINITPVIRIPSVIEKHGKYSFVMERSWKLGKKVMEIEYILKIHEKSWNFSTAYH